MVGGDSYGTRLVLGVDFGLAQDLEVFHGAYIERLVQTSMMFRTRRHEFVKSFYGLPLAMALLPRIALSLTDERIRLRLLFSLFAFLSERGGFQHI